MPEIVPPYIVNVAVIALNRKVDITGNKKSDDSANNVYLYTNKTLTIGDDFSTDSKIGVTTATSPTDCLGYIFFIAADRALLPMVCLVAFIHQSMLGFVCFVVARGTLTNGAGGQ